MTADAALPLRELRVDGSASENNLLMQLQSDLLGTRVIRPTVTETTALGAAYLAGLAVGVWKNKRDIARQWKAARQFKPAMKPNIRDALIVIGIKPWHGPNFNDLRLLFRVESQTAHDRMATWPKRNSCIRTVTIVNCSPTERWR